MHHVMNYFLPQKKKKEKKKYVFILPSMDGTVLPNDNIRPFERLFGFFKTIHTIGSRMPFGGIKFEKCRVGFGSRRPFDSRRSLDSMKLFVEWIARK